MIQAHRILISIDAFDDMGPVEISKKVADLQSHLVGMFEQANIEITAGTVDMDASNDNCDCSACTERRANNKGGRGEKSDTQVAQEAAYLTIKSSDPGLIASIETFVNCGGSLADLRCHVNDAFSGRKDRDELEYRLAHLAAEHIYYKD